MKNLRKILSLVLVVAMAFSMVIFASAKNYADFPDKADVDEQYIEAVDVAAALGIFAGDEDGKLDPKGTFTRAQAAKIVTYLSIGPNAAERLAPVGGIFTDVPANHWANKYIAYAFEAGILGGDGDGNFRPSDAVKGSEVAKLMNTVLGYGKKGEYTGRSWEINAISDAVARGLVTGNADLTAPALREEVIQYVFNTIVPEGPRNFMVEYSSIIGNYINAGSSSIVVGDTNKSYIGTTVFGLSSQGRVDAVDGSPSHFWRVGSKEITGLYANAPARVVSDVGTAIQMADFGLLDANNLFLANDVVVYINGSRNNDEDVLDYGYNDDFTPDFGAAETAAAKVGAEVSLFVSYNATTQRDEVYHIAIVEKTVATVLAAPKYSYGAISSIAGLPPVDYGKAYLGDTDVAKDDVVLFYEDGDGNIHIEKATAVEGQLTRFTKGAFGPAYDQITFGGKAYGVSGLDNVADDLKDRTAFAAGGGGNFNVDAVIYVDSTNRVVKFDADAVLLNYIYAYAFAADAFNDTIASRAMMVKIDGTMVTASIKAPTGSAIAPIAESAGWYSYTENNGVYTLTKAEDKEDSVVADNTTKIVNKAPVFLTDAAGAEFDDLHADNSTVFIFFNGMGTTVYTGINAVPNVTLKTGDKVIAVASGSAVRYVLVNTNEAGTGSANVAYFTQGYTSAYTNANGVYIFVYDGVVINGQTYEGSIEVASNDELAVATLYDIVADANGIYEATEKTIEAPAAGTAVIAINNGVFISDGAPVVVSADVVVWRAVFDLSFFAWEVEQIDPQLLSGNTDAYDYKYITKDGAITQLYITPATP